ncbi:hypothetical protein CPB86DRAFT_788413 [Serendipita vermifera]|nr:hypothetical protein CPB86DRAFT_788413 [Serendipita vermifera]
MPPMTNTNNDLQPRNSISVPFPDPTHHHSAPYSVPLSPTQLQQSQPASHDPSNPYHQSAQQQQQQQHPSTSNPAAVAAPRIQFPSNKNPAVQPAPIVPLTKEALKMARVAQDGSLFVPVDPTQVHSTPALPSKEAEKMQPQQPPYARQNSFPLTPAQQYRNERDPLVRTVSIERYKAPQEQRHGHVEASDTPARLDSLHRQLVLHEVRDDAPLVPAGAGGGTRKGKGKKKKDGDGRVSPDVIAYGTASTSEVVPTAISPAVSAPISKANLQTLSSRGAPKSDHTSLRAKDGSMIGSSTQLEEAEEPAMASRSAFSATVNTPTALMSPSDEAVSPATDLRGNRQKHNNGKGKRTQIHSHNLSDVTANASVVRSDGSQTPSPKIAPSAEWFDLFRRGTVPTTFSSNPSQPAKGLGVNLFGESEEKGKDKAVDLTRNRTAPQPSTHESSKRRKGSGELFNQLVSSNQAASSSGASDISRSSSFYRPMVAALLEPSKSQPKPEPVPPRERTQSDNMLANAATKPTPPVPSVPYRERTTSDNMLTKGATKPPASSGSTKLEPKQSDPLLQTQKATPNTGFTGSNAGPGLGSRDRTNSGAGVERAFSHPTWTSGISGGRALPTEPNRRIPMSLAMNRSLPMASVSQNRSLPTEPSAPLVNPPVTRPPAQPKAVVDTSRAQPATTLFTSPVSTTTTSAASQSIVPPTTTTTTTRTSTDRSERQKPRGVRMLPPIPQPPEPERRHTFD